MKRILATLLALLLALPALCGAAAETCLTFPPLGGEGSGTRVKAEDPALAKGGWTGFLPGLVGMRRELTVGADVALEDIVDFYYTYATSTFPPEYQRYRFYAEDGALYFFHEAREGEGWPLTEEDVTVSGTMALDEAQWARFCGCVEGGTVRDREESLDSGDAGPWLYLYWNGDGGECQEFSFSSWERLAEFEDLCAELAAQAQ